MSVIGMLHPEDNGDGSKTFYMDGIIDEDGYHPTKEEIEEAREPGTDDYE